MNSNQKRYIYVTKQTQENSLKIYKTTNLRYKGERKIKLLRTMIHATFTLTSISSKNQAPEKLGLR